MTATAIKQGNPTYSEAEWRMRVDLAACHRLSAHFGYSDIIWNHITARVPGEKDHFLLNRFGMRFDEVTASSLVKLDLDGNVLEGPKDLNITGFVIHSAIHAAREDIVCVMHAHTPGGVAVAALESGLLPVAQDAMMFYERIGYHDYEGLSTNVEERERLAANLGKHFAMIMRNHGLLTAGKTVAEAFIRMHYLERACRAQVDAMSTGQRLKLPPPEICEQAAGQYDDFWPGKYEWPALIRLLDAKDASYKI